MLGTFEYAISKPILMCSVVKRRNYES